MIDLKKNISVEEADKLIDSLLTINSEELGVLISLLSFKYMKEYKISKESFIKSLSNCIDKLEKDNN